MILAQFLGMVIFFIPAIIVATIARSVISGIVTPISNMSGMTDFEAAIALLIPYLILVYCAIIRPITNFWQSVRGSRQIPTRRDYE